MMPTDIITPIVAKDGKAYLSIDGSLGLKEEDLFAQVTVIDGDYGDCNIVDLHQPFPSSQPGPSNQAGVKATQWRRVLIDTGVYRVDTFTTEGGKVEEKVIAQTVVDRLLTRAVPLLPGGTNDVPPLREMQITHFDNDHIGNAGTIMTELKPKLEEWGRKDPNYVCELVMNKVPPAWPSLEVVPKDIKLQGTSYMLSFRIQGLDRWLAALQKYGITGHVEAKYRTSAKRPTGAEAEPGSANSIFSNQKDKDLEIIRNSKGKHSLIQIPMTAADVERVIKAFTDDQKVPNLRVKLVLGVMWDDVLADDWVPTDITRTYELEFDFSTHLIRIMIPSLSNTSSVKTKPWYTRGEDKYKNLEDKSVPPVKKAPHPHEVYKESLGDLMEAVQIINAKSSLNRDLVKHKQPNADIPKSSLIEGEHITSPAESIQEQVVKLMLLRIYSKSEDAVDDDFSLFEDSIINRASVVTVFSHSELLMKMLFTGDAYDQPCDLSRTTAVWSGDAKEETHHFDVIKIPHHGSNKTADSGFYQRFRANVYLICGAHYKHGNPKYSSIQAIVQGFENQKRANGEPYRLFFSDPDADQDKGRYKSAIRKVLGGNDTRPTRSRDYKAYKLKARGEGIRAGVPWGSILFYRGNGNHMKETWSNTEWEEIQRPPI